MEETASNIDEDNLQTETTTTIVESNTLENTMDGNETASLSANGDEGENETTVDLVQGEDNDTQPNGSTSPTD